ncbi:MAG: hypothetical protein ACP5VR_12275 [Acidimicrobiales bacterium]
MSSIYVLLASSTLRKASDADEPKRTARSAAARASACTILGQRTRDTARQPENGTDGLVGHDDHKLSQLMADAGDCFASLDANRTNDNQDVALAFGARRPTIKSETQQGLPPPPGGAAERLADCSGRTSPELG